MQKHTEEWVMNLIDSRKKDSKAVGFYAIKMGYESSEEIQHVTVGNWRQDWNYSLRSIHFSSLLQINQN